MKDLFKALRKMFLDRMTQEQAKYQGGYSVPGSTVEKRTLLFKKSFSPVNMTRVVALATVRRYHNIKLN